MRGVHGKMDIQCDFQSLPAVCVWRLVSAHIQKHADAYRHAPIARMWQHSRVTPLRGPDCVTIRAKPPPRAFRRHVQMECDHTLSLLSGIPYFCPSARRHVSCLSAMLPFVFRKSVLRVLVPDHASGIFQRSRSPRGSPTVPDLLLLPISPHMPVYLSLPFESSTALVLGHVSHGSPDHGAQWQAVVAPETCSPLITNAGGRAIWHRAKHFTTIDHHSTHQALAQSNLWATFTPRCCPPGCSQNPTTRGSTRSLSTAAQAQANVPSACRNTLQMSPEA